MRGRERRGAYRVRETLLRQVVESVRQERRMIGVLFAARLHADRLAAMLHGGPRIWVVATAAGAVKALRDRRPDVVLLDMTIADNAWLVRGLKFSAGPGAKVVADRVGLNA